MRRSKTFGHIPGIPVGTWWETRYANHMLLFSCLTNSETEKTVAMMLFMRTQEVYGFLYYYLTMVQPVGCRDIWLP